MTSRGRESIQMSGIARCVIAMMLVLLAACRGRDPGVSRLLETLQKCDFGPVCASALSQVRALSPEVAESPGGAEVRRLALRVGLEAASAFPPLDSETFPAVSAEDLVREAHATKDDEAGTVASLLARPSCGLLQDALSVYRAGGPYSEAALMAGMQVLAQTLAAITADRAFEFGLAARELVGCTMSDRASLGAVLVQTRALLHELAEQCRRSPPAQILAKSSCKAVQDLLLQRTLPLPWPDSGAGDLLYAMPPPSLRGIGLHRTPPFAVVLTAGRLGVYDQPVLSPSVLSSPETKVEWVLDLRSRHVPDDVFLAFKQIFESRKPVSLDEVQAVFFVVDRTTPAAELFEVLSALTATSDAVAAVALVIPGRPIPVFLPVNYQIEERILMDPLGRGRAFGREAAMLVRLTPFRAELMLRDRTEVVTFPRGTQVDLRPVYRAAWSLIGDGGPVSAKVITDGPVPVGLLTSVIEVLSFRVPEAALESPGAFSSAVPVRDRDARPLPLCAVIVVGTPD